MDELVNDPEFRPMRKQFAVEAVEAIKSRWSTRLAVHVWDKLDLSRSKMDTLRRLLSYLYDPIRDAYNTLRIWSNPDNPTDYVAFPHLPGSCARETLFTQLADECGIVVGANGRCERDAVKLATALYSNFTGALRNDFTIERPAGPILYFDGTGGSLGKGITHVELGSADFEGDCKQSLATLSPLALYEGSDHAFPLRDNLSHATATFNTLCSQTHLERDDGEGGVELLPSEPLVVGDMQGVKAVMGMASRSHSVWCKCRARVKVVDGEGPQHNYGDVNSDFKTFDEMSGFYERIGCEFEEYDFLLACAHLSRGVFEGGRFTPFTCPEPTHVGPGESRARSRERVIWVSVR